MGGFVVLVGVFMCTSSCCGQHGVLFVTLVSSQYFSASDIALDSSVTLPVGLLS